MEPGLKRYIQEIKRLKPLPKSEVNALVVRAQAGDFRARNRVVEGHLFMVIHVVARTMGRVDMESVSVGNMALFRAVQMFDPARSVDFPVYAFICIRNALLVEMYRQRMVSLEAPAGRDRTLAETIPVYDRGCEDWRPLFSCLTERQRQVIREYYLADRDMREISRSLGVSHQRVGQIKQEALRKMRQANCFDKYI